jgi:PAS domain S-box-containing protein
MFGYPADELVGRSVAVLAPDSRRAQYQEYLEKHLRARRSASLVVDREVECLRKDGATFPGELIVSSTTHGEERLLIGFIRDLSEKQRLEARLSKLHENRLASMAEMATSLAHEINQPLQVAASYLSIAQRRAGDNREVVEAVDKASAQVVRAGRIVGHLREFVARRESDMTTQSLHELIRKAGELTVPTAKQANVAMTLRLEAAQDRVLADNVQIEQALVNLIRNGIDAIGASSRREVTIGTSLVDGDIQTEVIDSGPGLALANESELFEPFNSTKTGGLGVGLSITRSIIEAHHGRISAENIAGGGAKFTFTLPLDGSDGGG